MLWTFAVHIEVCWFRPNTSVA